MEEARADVEVVERTGALSKVLRDGVHSRNAVMFVVEDVAEGDEVLCPDGQS